MDDFVTALGLVMVIEGAFYALLPDGAKRMMAAVLMQPSGRLRRFGVAVAAAGVVIVWLIRG